VVETWYNDAVTAEGWARDVDIERASPARMYDYYLGGSHNFAVDREAAEQVMVAIPNVREMAATNRAFLRHAVIYLLDVGVRQFLDIGSGIPTVGNVHEIAQRVDPPAKVVYVDIDPVAVAHSQQLLAGNPDAVAIAGDLAEPRAILDAPQVVATLDFDRPIGLLLLSMLPFVPDEKAYPAVAELVAALPSGSYLVISHGVIEGFGHDQYSTVGAVYERSTSRGGGLRDRAGIERFFAGLDLVEPGLVWLPQWRGGELADGGPNPERIAGVAGVARKP
jgi:S-adenosyl methyltransferase